MAWREWWCMCKLPHGLWCSVGGTQEQQQASAQKYRHCMLQHVWLGERCGLSGQLQQLQDLLRQLCTRPWVHSSVAHLQPGVSSTVLRHGAFDCRTATAASALLLMVHS
jgi:hypothetical protein